MKKKKQNETLKENLVAKEKIEKPQKMPQTFNLNREQIEIESQPAQGFLSAHHLDKNGKISIPDREFCMRHGNDSDFREMRTKLEKKVKDKLQPIFWKCNKCGFVMRVPGDRELDTCLSCNWQRLKDGGMMVKMNSKEIKQHLKNQEEIRRRTIEQLKKNEKEFEPIERQRLREISRG